MEIDEEFLKKWKEVYVKMLSVALERVVAELARDIEYYKGLGVPTLSKFEQFLTTGLSVVFRLREDFWENNDEINKDPRIIHAASRTVAKNCPEYAKKQQGIGELYINLSNMNVFSAHITDKYALTALRSFCEMYHNDPDINDVDVLVNFIIEQKVCKNQKYWPILRSIPQEVKDSLDLGFGNANSLKDFVKKYTDQYSMDDSSLGGPKL